MMMKWLLLFGLLSTLGLLLMRMVQAAEIPRVGQAAPEFNLPDQNGIQHKLSDYTGKWLVLYFYPKDDTPGCTEEACKFRDDLHRLTGMGAEVAGISVDDSNSHAEFAKKYNLPFPLLADKSAEVSSRYGVLLNLGFFRVARRYTFLINPQGKISKVYDKVNTSRHSGEIVDDLKILMSESVH
jgi:thioredoxin-dependent peroxiredoxin